MATWRWRNFECGKMHCDTLTHSTFWRIYAHSKCTLTHSGTLKLHSNTFRYAQNYSEHSHTLTTHCDGTIKTHHDTFVTHSGSLKTHCDIISLVRSSALLWHVKRQSNTFWHIPLLSKHILTHSAALKIHSDTLMYTQNAFWQIQLHSTFKYTQNHSDPFGYTQTQSETHSDIQVQSKHIVTHSVSRCVVEASRRNQSWQPGVLTRPYVTRPRLVTRHHDQASWPGVVTSARDHQPRPVVVSCRRDQWLVPVLVTSPHNWPSCVHGDYICSPFSNRRQNASINIRNCSSTLSSARNSKTHLPSVLCVKS